MANSATDRSATARPQPGKRERLVAAAMQLLHRQGVERTTLAEIAELAKVPAGNVYYYFKTKDEVITAVVEAHKEQLSATLRSIEARHQAPKARLTALARELTGQRELVAEFGCPLGGLCTELDKRRTEPRLASAELMGVPLSWAEAQFRLLGRRDARDLALHLLAVYEGSAVLANALHDPEVLAAAGRRLNRWIESL